MTKDDPKGSFIRWQSITIAQLTYAVNLVLGFAVAALGFQISIFVNGVEFPYKSGGGELGAQRSDPVVNLVFECQA